MKKILSAAMLCAVFSGSIMAGTAGTERKETFKAGQVKIVLIQTEAGNITVKAGDKSSIEAETVKYAPENCKVTMEIQGENLLLKAESPKRSFFSGFKKGCETGFAVMMPASIPLTVLTGSGDTKVADMTGKGDFRAGSGNMSLAGLSGKLNIRTGSGSVSGRLTSDDIDVMAGSGDIDLRGLTGSFTGKTGSGRISAAWKSVPLSPGRCADVKTGSGGIELAFPAGSKIGAKTTVGSGNVQNAFDYSEQGFDVRAMTGSGDITLKKT
jgi:DUF4097 and DUF4098 domain-containing protein YvlB